MAGSISQLQLSEGRCMYCRRILLFENLEEHLAEDCIVVHSTTWERGDWAQERFSDNVIRLLGQDDYFSKRKARFLHKRARRCQRGFDDVIIDVVNMEVVESDTKNCIRAPFDSSYLKENFLGKVTGFIANDKEIGLKWSFRSTQVQRCPLKSVGRAIVIFGRVERSCLTLCKQEGVEVIHQPEHCLPDQNEEAIAASAEKLVEYAKAQFIRRDNERAFERMWARAQSGRSWRKESKMIKQLASSEGSEEDDIPSLEEPFSSNKPIEQPIPEAVRQQAKSIYERAVHRKNHFFNKGDLQWFSDFQSLEILGGAHRLASRDSFTSIDIDSPSFFMNIPLYRAFVGHALYGDRPLEALWGEAA